MRILLPLSRLMMLLAGLTILSPLRGAEKESAHWAFWRGPAYQGHSDDTRVPLTWSTTENILWKTKLQGVGNSSPIVWRERIFLTTSSKDGKERHVLCIRTTDGKVLWDKTAAKVDDPGKSHAWNGYASPSCTTDGQRVYAFFGTPGLFCYDFEGTLVWKQQFGIFTSSTGWGVGASPFLFEDLVIQNCDNDGADALKGKAGEAAPMALIALDKASGKERWRTPRNMGKGFSTPVLIKVKDRTELVLNSPQGVWSYDPRSGKEIWHCDRKGEQAHFGEPLPVFNDDMMFGASGRPGPLQAIRLGGTGDISKSHVAWQVERKGHRDVSSQILTGDYLYAADNKGMLTCYEAKTGKVLFNERIGAKSLASPVAVRGKILYVLEDGESLVIDPGPKLQIVGRNKLEGGSLDFLGSPAIADGKLYLRSQSTLYCIGAKK